MAWWLLPVLFGIGALVVLTWDALRDLVYRWAHQHGHERLKRVVLKIDTIVSRATYRLKVLVSPAQGTATHVVEERVVSFDELPPEVRQQALRNKTTRVNVTDQILELKH